MKQENSPHVEPAIDIVVFDVKGRRINAPTIPTLIIEPETILANETATSLSSQIHQLASDNVNTPAIGLKFAKFADGRSYSIAARLREAGYRGELHAMGDINQELMFLLKRVGFTHAHIPEPGVANLPKSIIEPFEGYYQAGVDGSLAPWQANQH